MASVLDKIRRYQRSIESESGDESKVLRCIKKLFKLNVTVQHLQETGVGRTVYALRKEPEEVGRAARALVAKWKIMVAAEESDQEGDHRNDTSTHNGHGSGRESDDHLQQSRNSHDHQSSSTNSTPQSNHQEQHREMNGHHSGTKRKYQSSEEEDHESKKKFRHTSSSEDDRKKVVVKQEKLSDNESSSSSSESYESDSDSYTSESSREDVKVKPEIKQEIKKGKTESPERNKQSSSHSKQSHSNHDNRRKESSSRESSKRQESSDRDKHSHHKSSKDLPRSSEVSSKSSSSKHKSSHEKENSSDKRHKSDTSSDEKKESKSSSKHSSDKHKSSSNKRDSSSERHKSSEKHSSKEHKSSSHKEKDSDKHKSSEKDHKHKSKESSSSSKSKESSSSSKSKESSSSSKSKESSSSSKSKENSGSSKEKHSSYSKDKLKEKSSSSKERSSSTSEKKHSSSDSKSHSDKSKHRSDERSSEKKSKEKSSSSSSHRSKSSSSSSKLQDDVPKKKSKLSSEESGEDGIDCGSGASFAEALGMAISPSKPKKKSYKDINSPINTFSNDLSPAFLLAPTARLAPLPALEISALPEISPHYKPRPPPKFLTHFSDEDAISAGISSKNQRTKVYSGNKVVGKITSLYDMCVHVLQEHIDALEYTGGVPYDILKPVIDRATPQQLFLLEHYNPYLMEDTDHLWQKFCEKSFRNKRRQELESWREMYMRCQEEQESKLKSLTANIRLTQEAKKAPIKQTKMAYVDSIVKPPRNIARKQALHGTAHAASASPASRVASLSTTPGVLKGGAPRPPSAAPVSTSSLNKPKKAPLMQKALQFMRGRKR